MNDEAGILNSVLSCNLSEIRKVASNKESANSAIEGGDGLTLLHIAAGVNSPHVDQVVSYLLQLGANPNARAQDGLTPVHIASMWNNHNVLEKLLCYGGNPWLHDFDSKNAFDLASENSSNESQDLLNNFKRKLKAGSDTTSDFTESCESIFSFFDGRYDEKLVINKDVETFSASSEDINDLAKKLGCLSVYASDGYQTDSSDIADTFERIKLWLKETSEQVKCSSIKRCSSDYFSDFSKVQAQTSSTVSDRSIESSVNFDSQSEAFSEIFGKGGSTSSASSSTSNLSACESDLDLLDNTWGTLIDDALNQTVIPSMAQPEHEITHADDAEGIVLIERWGSSFESNKSYDSCSSGKASWKSYRTAREKLSSSASSISDELLQLSNTQIFFELTKQGDNPGPVTDSTRHLYLMRLSKLKNGRTPIYAASPTKYTKELSLFLENKLNLQNAEHLELEMSEDFDRDSVSDNWREGGQRCSFNYFLLDPRVTKNLPLRSQSLSLNETAEIFLNALFYVGKGTRSRPYHHLYEAVKAINSDTDNTEFSAKVRHILDIWESGLGVVCLHCFQNCIPAESYTREACIIDAIGLPNLTNIKKGNYYGIASKWTGSKKRQVGVLLLCRALKIFCLEGERFIKPKDIRKDDAINA